MWDRVMELKKSLMGAAQLSPKSHIHKAQPIWEKVVAESLKTTKHIDYDR